MPCEKCPCPDLCLARPEYCEWAAADPPDPHRLRAACDRSRIAAGLPPERPAPSYPSALQMAGNLAGAVGRVVVAAARGEAVKVPAEVIEERRRICGGCEQFDPGPSRCRLCGCYTAVKLALAQEACPLDPPRWGRWAAPADPA